MYAPLKFIEQMERYIKVPNARGMETVVNAKAMKFAESFLKEHRSTFYHDCGAIRSSSETKMDINEYHKICNNFFRVIGVQGGMDSLDDFFDLMGYYDVRNIWRKNKLSYVIDNDLFDTLINMETPKLAPVDCLSKLPANCFYIDYNGKGSEICENLEGTFITTDETSEELNIVLTHLVNSEKLSRELLISTVYRLPYDGDSSDKFIPNIPSYEDNKIMCEDDIVRNVNEKKLSKIIFNFLVYLHAANRDVQISERTRKNHETVHTTIKNKFREVKEFEVGFTYGRTIRSGDTRVKYVGGEKPNGVANSPKSSHYRSAHWHHYWVGSGEDKQLIIKWVEGVFVNGGKDEAENVQIHKVK